MRKLKSFLSIHLILLMLASMILSISACDNSNSGNINKERKKVKVKRYFVSSTYELVYEGLEIKYVDTMYVLHDTLDQKIGINRYKYVIVSD